jgi:hypothetical protein
MEKLVWVTIGKTEHQAWLLEELGEAHTVLVRWESTGRKEQVHVLSVHQNMPSRCYRKTITKRFNYDERVKLKRRGKNRLARSKGERSPGVKNEKPARM